MIKDVVRGAANIISASINLPSQHGNTVYTDCVHTSGVCETKTISHPMWVKRNRYRVEDDDYILAMFAMPAHRSHC